MSAMGSTLEITMSSRTEAWTELPTHALCAKKQGRCSWLETCTEFRAEPEGGLPERSYGGSSSLISGSQGSQIEGIDRTGSAPPNWRQSALILVEDAKEAS
jgi:hypothetical protein